MRLLCYLMKRRMTNMECKNKNPYFSSSCCIRLPMGIKGP
jgi:hypothetical protein